MQFTKTLPPNLKGRDFVVGDLHGAYERLTQLLQHAQFDSSIDRLILVGDLVDRGPDSEKCMALLDEPWVFCVRGNHEQLMLDEFYGGMLQDWWIPNGGSWGLPYLKTYKYGTPEEKEEPGFVEFMRLLEKVKELPVVLSIEQAGGGYFHVIHAEIPYRNMTMGVPSTLTDADLMDENTVKQLMKLQTGDGDFLTWGRYTFGAFIRKVVANEKKALRILASKEYFFGPELGHIYSGHSIMHRPLVIGGQTNLDTCGYGSLALHPRPYEALTMVEHATRTFYQANRDGVKVVEPVVLSSDSIMNVRESVNDPENFLEIQEAWNSLSSPAP